MSDEQKLREHLLYLLGGGGAHIGFDEVVKDFPVALVNRRVEHVPYTAWQVVEHMRIAQWDILEFCRDPAHVSPEWPEGYWPEVDATADEETWNQSLAAFRADLAAMQKLVKDAATDLDAVMPHADGGQTILREALLVADHNAYHLGVLSTLKRILQT